MNRLLILLFILFLASFPTCYGQNIQLVLSIDKLPPFIKQSNKTDLQRMMEDSIIKKSSQSYNETYHKSIYLFTSVNDSITKPDYILDINLTDTTSMDNNAPNKITQVSGRIYESSTPRSSIPEYSIYGLGLSTLKVEEEKKNITFLINWLFVMAKTRLHNIPYATPLPYFNTTINTMKEPHKTFVIQFIDNTNQQMPASINQLKQLINNYFILKQYDTYSLYKKIHQDDCYKYLLMEDAPLSTTSSSNILILPIKIQVEKGNLKVLIAKNSENVKLKSMGEAVQQVHIIDPIVLAKYPSTLIRFQESFDWLIRINTAW